MFYCFAIDGSKGFDAIPDWQDEAVLTNETPSLREAYHDDFCRFHKELEHNRFRKLVLARSIIETKDERATPRSIFLKACEKYPRSYIALFLYRRDWYVAYCESRNSTSW